MHAACDLNFTVKGEGTKPLGMQASIFGACPKQGGLCKEGHRT